MRVNGGTWSHGTSLYVGGSSVFGFSATGTGIVNLNGGTVSVNSGSGVVRLTEETYLRPVVSTATLNLGTGGPVGTLLAAEVNGGGGTATVNLNHTGSYTFAPKLTGNLVVNKLGSGTSTLSGANTYTGPTTVSAGTLKAGVASVPNVSGAFGDNSAVTLANVAGAALDITGFNTQIGSLTGGGAAGGNVILGAATLTIGGNNTTPAAYAGVISGTGALTKIGTGAQTLSGPNTYTGATTVSAGNLKAGVASVADVSGAFGNNSAVIMANVAGANLDITGFDTQIGSLTGGGTIGGNVILGAATLTIGGDNTSPAAYAGVISGIGGGLTKIGTGTLTLTGTNTYTGETRILQGAIEYGVGNVLNNGGDVRVDGGTLGLGANSDTVGAVTLKSGAITSSTGVLTGSSFAVESGSISAKLAGAGTQMNKTTAGTVTLSGINTFTGRTTIDAGTLSISQDANLGAAPGSFAANQLTLSHGGRLKVTTGFTMAANRGMTVLPGAGSAGVIDLAAAQVLTIPGGIVKNGTVLELKGGAGSVFHLNGVISGVSPNSDLIVNGGTTNLGAANTYDGPTFIRNGGTLNAEVAGALPAATRTALTLDDTGSGSSTLSLGADNTVASLTGAASSSVLLGANALTLGATSGSTSFAGTISGLGGSIIKDGASTQTPTGTNTFSGTTTVSAGSLEVGAGGSLDNTSSVTVNSGGTLLISGGGANQINNAAVVTLDGNGVGTTGNIALGGISAIDETVGALTLSSSSIIDFGTFGAGHTLRFADSSALSGAWSGTLSIYNWTGSPFIGGGPDHLFFGTDATGLDSSQLNQINFYSGGFGSAFLGTGGILSNGEIVPVPEASGVFAGLALCGLAGWRERRKAKARRRDSRSLW